MIRPRVSIALVLVVGIAAVAYSDGLAISMIIRGNATAGLYTELENLVAEKLDQRGLQITDVSRAPNASIPDAQDHARDAGSDLEIVATVTVDAEISVEISAWSVPDWSPVFSGVATSPDTQTLGRGVDVLARRVAAAAAELNLTLRTAEVPADSTTSETTSETESETGEGSESEQETNVVALPTPESESTEETDATEHTTAEPEPTDETADNTAADTTAVEETASEVTSLEQETEVAEQTASEPEPTNETADNTAADTPAVEETTEQQQVSTTEEVTQPDEQRAIALAEDAEPPESEGDLEVATVSDDSEDVQLAGAQPVRRGRTPIMWGLSTSVSEALAINLAGENGVWFGSLSAATLGAHLRIATVGSVEVLLAPCAGYRLEYVVPDRALYRAGSHITAHTLLAGLLGEVIINERLRFGAGAQITYPFAGLFFGPYGEVPFSEEQQGVIPYGLVGGGYDVYRSEGWSIAVQAQLAVGFGVPGVFPMELGAEVVARRSWQSAEQRTP